MFWPPGTDINRIMPCLELDVAYADAKFTRDTPLDTDTFAASLDKSYDTLHYKLVPAANTVRQHGHVLLLHGHTQGAMLFHCGAIVYLAETRQLQRYSVLWAENMSVPLVHLVAHMWPGLVRASASSIQRLVMFSSMLASSPVDRWPNVLVSILDTLGVGEETKVMPLVYTSLDDPDTTRPGRPLSTMCTPEYWADRPFADTMKEAIKSSAPLKSEARTEIVGTWAALTSRLPFLAAETHARVLNIHVVYAGHQRPPPLRIGQLPCIDPGCLLTWFEFVSALWVLAQQAIHGPDTTLPRVSLRMFSVYHGDTHAVKYTRAKSDQRLHWPTQLKARVCHFMCTHRSHPITERIDMVALVNWGYLATWSTTRLTDKPARVTHPCTRSMLVPVRRIAAWDDQQLRLGNWKREAERAAIAQGPAKRSLCRMCSTDIVAPLGLPTAVE